MTFRDSEKLRYRPLKCELFSPPAQLAGVYRGILRDFCLGEGCADENLFSAFREAAITYFADRRIPWHDGANARTRPSNHLCCSQSCCVNFLFPFIDKPYLLAQVFRHVYPDITAALSIDSQCEPALATGGLPHVAFEWIGERDHLSEWRRRRGAPTRGANYTSADFVLRFRRSDGRIHVVLGEWKYTESYGVSDLALSTIRGSGDVRLETYRDAFGRPGGIFRDWGPDLYRALFFEPLYQLMRLQLLAQEMEVARELGADIVSVLHVSPEANREFREFNPSPRLRGWFPSKGVLEVWQELVPTDRFRSLSVETLLGMITREARSTIPEWVAYLERRYGWTERPSARELVRRPVPGDGGLSARQQKDRLIQRGGARPSC